MLKELYTKGVRAYLKSKRVRGRVIVVKKEEGGSEGEEEDDSDGGGWKGQGRERG